MKSTLLLALGVATVTILVNAGSFGEKSKLSAFDIAAIEQEAAEKVAELNSPSLSQRSLSALAALLDAALDNDHLPTLKELEEELNKPQEPVTLTQFTSSPKLCPIAVRISDRH